MGFKEKVYGLVPYWVQNIMISVYNILAYRIRYGGSYKKHREHFQATDKLTISELLDDQNKRLANFHAYVLENSPYYKERYEQNNNSFPVIDKEELRQNIAGIKTIADKDGSISKTGGTTGKSLEVVFTHFDTQERFAMLDNFRSKFGYKLGEPTAWFSARSLLNKKDIKKGRFWRTDYIYKVRYYSTFHVKDEYLKYYIEDLIKFRPKYMVGFPSTMLEIAGYGERAGYDFPAGVIKAIFPTAETVTQPIREVIERFFKTNMYDQYASSEGAPFIFECINHNLHLELQSGLFEVLNDNNSPSNKGRLILTSFTTHGAPLLRYDIGDTIELSSRVCSCGNNNPLVEMLLGRIDDYIYSPDNGRVSAGNISNTIKNTTGIIKFQVVQNTLDAIIVNIVVDSNLYNKEIESILILNWEERVGSNMQVTINKVDDIPVENSGKFRFIKNNIKHLLQ